MATTITNATLTVTLTESVSLNGSDQGATNTLSISSINEVFKRIVSCTASQTTPILSFNAAVHGAAGAIDLQDCKYIRLTNKDDTNAIEIAVVGAATLYQVELAAGESHILGNPEAIMLSEAEHGIAIQATITYVPLNITEKLRFQFDENSLLRLS